MSAGARAIAAAAAAAFACAGVVLAGLAGCERPDILLVCHNSNCAEPTEPEKDDTIEALRESLVLEVAGRPAIDGTELDLFWRASDGTCLLAHDLAGGATDLAGDAAQVLADHLARPGPITSADQPFQVFIELKDFVDPDKSVHHTPEQRRLHALCAWDVYTTITGAAVANGRELDV